MRTLVYVTPTKVSNHANMAGSRFYTWASSEERNGMLVKEVVLLTRVNGMITLGRSEIRTLAWTPSASVKKG